MHPPLSSSGLPEMPRWPFYGPPPPHLGFGQIRVLEWAEAILAVLCDLGLSRRVAGRSCVLPSGVAAHEFRGVISVNLNFQGHHTNLSELPGDLAVLPHSAPAMSQSRAKWKCSLRAPTAPLGPVASLGPHSAQGGYLSHVLMSLVLTVNPACVHGVPNYLGGGDGGEAGLRPLPGNRILVYWLCF
jgi:hypothetical protein